MSNPESWRRNPISSFVSRMGTTLALVFTLFALAPGLPANAQDTARPAGGGFDFFQTNAKGTNFNFSGDFAIPAGFFGEGSARFTGKVSFKGVPVGSFRDQKTGNTDTVIERKSTPELGKKFPSEGRTEIALAALSLQSTQPIKVRVGKKTELWEVKVQPSPSRPSTGSMTITQQNARGGTANSELTVYPLFTFVRSGEKAEKTLDTGTLKLGADAAGQLTLRATKMPWSTKPPARAVAPELSNNFFGSVQANRAVDTSENGRIAAHLFLPAALTNSTH